jgi:DegV family protein with EDD domain
MPISYLNGPRFYHAFVAGGEAVIKKQSYLNKINVFPVADADTGTNLATTMRTIVQAAEVAPSLKTTLETIADAALSGARGNSGIIFAQYLYGLSRELPARAEVSVELFSRAALDAVKYLYQSIMNPVEGTMLTVIREWAEALHRISSRQSDYVHAFSHALQQAQQSVKDTPNKLKALADAGVVDAGASGFVHFLEGVLSFIQRGSLREVVALSAADAATVTVTDVHGHQSDFRYCTEAIITQSTKSLKEVRDELTPFGDSLIVAGDCTKMHVHLHTDHPDRCTTRMMRLGQVTNMKVDDMQRQYQIHEQRKYPIGLITDSACDLPAELLDAYQIQQVSFGIHFGDTSYIDKKTLHTDQFYHLLRHDHRHPVSSQPSPSRVGDYLDFATSHYSHTLAIHISSRLTGVYQTAMQQAQKRDGIHVVDSRQLSVSLGLVVLRAAQAIASGMAWDEILQSIDSWCKKATILTDVNTLKYMVRGGRVSPMKGAVARLLNLKPIVTLDASGAGAAYGKSFSRAGNMKKIITSIEEMMLSSRIREYAIVHAQAPQRAAEYAEKLTAILGKKPAYITPLSPVVGVHNGPGTVAVGIMEE